MILLKNTLNTWQLWDVDDGEELDSSPLAVVSHALGKGGMLLNPTIDGEDRGIEKAGFTSGRLRAIVLHLSRIMKKEVYTCRHGRKPTFEVEFLVGGSTTINYAYIEALSEGAAERKFENCYGDRGSVVKIRRID